jgi:hypothetical protein
MTTGLTGRPPNKTCVSCNRKSVYPEKMFGDWFYPRVQVCFDCLMIQNNRYDKVRSRKVLGKMKDRVELLFPLSVYILLTIPVLKGLIRWLT